MKITAVIVAGGSGSRMGADKNKVFLELLGKPILSYTLEVFETHDKIDDIVLVSRDCDTALCKKLATSKVSSIICGGSTRQESVWNGLHAASGDMVVVHDGARAFIDGDAISMAIKECENHGSSAVGVKCKDTLKSVDEQGFIAQTVNRDNTFQIQTPQVFMRDEILSAHIWAKENAIDVTDDCMLFEMIGKKIKLVQGSYDNIKITTPEDLAIGVELLKRRTVK